MYILFRFSFFLLFGVEIRSDRFWIRVYLLWNGGLNFFKLLFNSWIYEIYEKRDFEERRIGFLRPNQNNVIVVK